jgi:hypothetical protein
LLIFSERQALEPVCITLGDQHTLWALDVHGKLWFRTGMVPKKPQGDDDHWWQVGTRSSLTQGFYSSFYFLSYSSKIGLIDTVHFYYSG